MLMRNSGKIEGLELLRFILAAGVMFYHYLYYAPATNLLPVSAEPVSGLLYARFGVSAFFILSGFVIAMSATSRTAYEFGAARVSRLWPALVVCATVTFACTYFWPGPRPAPEVISYLRSAFLLPMLAGGEMVDGSYWSIVIEMRFYLVVFAIMLVMRGLKKLRLLIVLWMSASYLSLLVNSEMLRILVMSPHSGNFIIGATFYIWKIRSEAKSAAILIGPAIILTIVQTHIEFETIDMLDGERASILQSIAIVLICISLFIAAFFEIKGKRLAKIARRLGAMSYPLYLIHQELGYWLIFHLGNSVHVLSYTTLSFITGAFMIIFSYVVAKFAEPAGKRLLTSFLGGTARVMASKVAK
ncbi:acyltransferase (plasmid) [Rhizobium rosettiformans]|uniref:Acyltransferase n=1 Tax=Rhizobium rosettiformans TaxID=1368430 RepID=A0ABX7F4M5_9HYPH|nr:acyltransferase [Rhizobium rosettiformans]QRF54336.1 acyltransferase [Rhizobium rosettiformans]